MLVSLPHHCCDMSHGLLFFFLCLSLLVPVCCCFSIPSQSDCYIYIHCSPSQILVYARLICDTTVSAFLYGLVLVFLETIWCHHTFGFNFFITSNSLMSLRLSNIALCDYHSSILLSTTILVQLWLC